MAAVPDPEFEYRRLRKADLPGWGGEQFVQRQKDWSATLAEFGTDSRFPKVPGRILELGCGNGMVSMLVADRAYEVVGVDLSSEAVGWARERFSQAGLPGKFRQGDVCSMPWLGDGAFDAVIDGNCLHCIIGADRARCLGEVRRTLRPGGAFLVSSMCGAPRSAEVYERFDFADNILLENGQPYRALMPAGDLIAELEAAGFHIYRSEMKERPWWDHLTLWCDSP